MTRPRQILPGSTYLVTRRCAQRQFLLKPSRTVREIFLYCLAYSASRSGIAIHGFTVLSNHFHLVCTDPLGELPRFMQWLDEFVARALNAYRGRWESFWAPGSYSEVRLLEAEDQLDKLVYALTNPVKHGLVKRARLWPGAKSLDHAYGETVTARRPEGFFREDGPMPEEASFTLARPPGFADRSDEDFGALLARRIDEREMELRQEFRLLGLRFAGLHAIRKARATDVPDGPAPRRRLNPRIACKDPGRRVVELDRLKAFQVEYRECFARWRKGVRSVLFPFGTYQLRVQAGVACRAPP